MKTDRLPAYERLMIFFGLVSFSFLFYRCIFTLNLHYTFFLWNLLIAFVPYIVSKQLLKYNELGIKAFLLLFVWLIFFPSCLYLFTDLLQIHKTDNFSIVYDIILFSSFAVTGMLPGLTSLKQVEAFLKKHMPVLLVRISVLIFIFLSSYSICLVRFLHLKSWNILADSKRLFYASKHNILYPQAHVDAWLSILALVFLINVIYTWYKKLYYLKKIRKHFLF